MTFLDRAQKIEAPAAIAAVAIPLFFLLVWGATGFPVFGWDAVWYRDIAAAGYRFDGNVLQQQNVAFLPGYALLIWLLHAVTGANAATCQVIASTACCIAGSLCFFRVLRRWFPYELSLLAVIIFSMNPFAIYLLNGYSECLLYLLCGIFFLCLEKKNYWLAALVLSYALITRPHSVSLYPVLIYRLADDSGLFAQGLRPTGRQIAKFIRASADRLFVTLLFPMLLTLFWYVKFDDSFLYLNALTAWSAAGSSSVYRQVGLLITSLLEVQTVTIDVFNSHVSVLAPHQFAALNVMLNLLGTAYLIKQRCHELALFCAGLLGFWFINSISADAGRHALMLVAMPIVLSAALVAVRPVTTSDGAAGTARLVQRLALGMASAGFTLVSFFHYVFYALIQLNGGWVS